ncbi:MAG: alpha-L-fucosidase [Bacteroidales bacterium]|nr:alpha-L-fucosidase [Bacteroidales bacterium]
MKTKIFLIVSLLVLFSCTNSPKEASDNSKIPYWLTEYSELYNANPLEASKAWFQDAKMGMFVHLNLASLCENGKADYLLWAEGNASDRLIEFVGYTREEYDNAENKNQLLFDKYTLENLDTDAICQLAVDANMKYIVLTTTHLGRVFNYKASHTDFTSLNAPVGRDIVADMLESCEKSGLGFFPYMATEYSITTEDVVDHHRAVISEMLSQYGPMAGAWFDGIGGYYQHPENYTDLDKTYEMIRELQPHGLISFKEGAMCLQDYLSPEHFMLEFDDWKFEDPGMQARWDIRRARWERQSQEEWDQCHQYKLREINTVIQECYNRDNTHVPSGWINDESARHLDADELYYLLEYARHCGSNLNINIGPRPDGSIHPDDVTALTALGEKIDNEGWPEIVHEIPVLQKKF